jgi:hypothetical protein
MTTPRSPSPRERARAREREGKSKGKSKGKSPGKGKGKGKGKDTAKKPEKKQDKPLKMTRKRALDVMATSATAHVKGNKAKEQEMREAIERLYVHFYKEKPGDGDITLPPAK